MNRLIRKLTLAFLLGLVLLGTTAPTLAWGQTGPFPTARARSTGLPKPIKFI